MGRLRDTDARRRRPAPPPNLWERGIGPPSDARRRRTPFERGFLFGILAALGLVVLAALFVALVGIAGAAEVAELPLPPAPENLRRTDVGP